MNKPHIYTPDSVRDLKQAEAAEERAANAEAQLKPGPFPVHALNKTQKCIAESLAEVHELPAELTAMPALAVIGAGAGKGWKLTGAVNGRENFEIKRPSASMPSPH